MKISKQEIKTNKLIVQLSDEGTIRINVNFTVVGEKSELENSLFSYNFNKKLKQYNAYYIHHCITEFTPPSRYIITVSVRGYRIFLKQIIDCLKEVLKMYYTEVENYSIGMDNYYEV